MKRLIEKVQTHVTPPICYTKERKFIATTKKEVYVKSIWARVDIIFVHYIPHHPFKQKSVPFFPRSHCQISM